VKRGRVEYHGRIHSVTVGSDGSLETDSGVAIPEADAVWLPPPHGTILALGLNYADHASELDFIPPEEPLIFIKSPSSLTGHKQPCCRPDDATYMHYEAELVAVIGTTARRVSREHAMHHVGGYTVCNDFAVRDYLENYYRPNLRVKCRDSLTPLGPYIIDADDVEDPTDLAIRTFVNGELRQEGSTRDMVFDIPYLIEYLSTFMTLEPGDMISTGTPKGLSDVVPGDEIICEVEKVGRLQNYIVSEADYYGA